MGVLGVATVVDGLAPISGTFRLGYQDPETLLMDRTSPLPHDVSSEAMKEALEELHTMANVDVTRGINGYGYDWHITVDKLGPIGSVTADGRQLTGPSASIYVSDTRAGSFPTGYGSYFFSAISRGETSYAYSLAGLTQGSAYLARVTAHNSRG